MRINLNGGTTVDDLVGQWVPANKPNKYIWVDGQLAAFMRNGGILVCDELNASPADINMVFNPVLDDERRLVLVQKESEVLYAHPEFWLVSTINPDGDYEGTKPMNHALRDRFQIIMNYHYELDIESKLIPDDALLHLIYKLRESSKIYTKVSTRTGIQVIKNRALYGADTALELFISRFTRDEQPVVRELASIMARTTAAKITAPPPTEDPITHTSTSSATSA
jgi:hypothetical protein